MPHAARSRGQAVLPNCQANEEYQVKRSIGSATLANETAGGSGACLQYLPSYTERLEVSGMSQADPFVVEGTLRNVGIHVPEAIRECSGISLYGHCVKSLLFSTDIAIIRNSDADAVLAVYPFTCQPAITQALLSAAEMPVLTGVGGAVTTGRRAVDLAVHSDMQGVAGVVVNASTDPATISRMAERVDVPIVVTVTRLDCMAFDQIAAGARIVNVAAAKETPHVVADIRRAFPQMPIMASGGTTDESILATIDAGANAISWTPPTLQELERKIMDRHRQKNDLTVVAA